jgi:hypothetical protein
MKATEYFMRQTLNTMLTATATQYQFDYLNLFIAEIVIVTYDHRNLQPLVTSCKRIRSNCEDRTDSGKNCPTVAATARPTRTKAEQPNRVSLVVKGEAWRNGADLFVWHRYLNLQPFGAGKAFVPTCNSASI